MTSGESLPDASGNEYGGFSFRNGQVVRSNSKPDEAGLFGQDGEEVDRRSY